MRLSTPSSVAQALRLSCAANTQASIPLAHLEVIVESRLPLPPFTTRHFKRMCAGEMAPM